MFRGTSTLKEYKNYLKKGFCNDHTIEFFEHEDAIEEREILKKILLFIRVRILDPILFGRRAFCEKIHFLMQRSNYFSQCLSGNDLPDKAYECIIILDSVVIFTLCHLSKICCVGALFQSQNKSSSEDPEVKFLQNLLHADRFQDTDISYLNPFLKENFPDCDLDLIKVCYVSTLLIVRSKTLHMNIRTALKTADDICTTCDVESFKSKANARLEKKDYAEALAIYTAGLKNNPYCPDLYMERALVYATHLQKPKAAELDLYTSLIFNSSCLTFCHLGNKLVMNEDMHKELIEIVNFALVLCSLDGCMPCLIMQRMKKTFEPSLIRDTDLSNGMLKSITTQADKRGKLPEIIDSFPELVEASDSDEDSIGTEETTAEVKIESTVKSVPGIESISKNVPELVEASDSDETDTEAPVSSSSLTNQLAEGRISEEMEKKIASVVERQRLARSKKSNSVKQRRSLSEGLPSIIDSEGWIDYDVVHQYLKEVSEALIEECGYKALQLFCGPLKELVKDPEAFEFKEDQAVCVKYSYGVAYCQSGEYDDLQKCMVVFKDIIENYKSVNFPAAYYALGLACRKLNRFKEALGYLDTVKSILDKGIRCKCFFWAYWYSPGPLIEESKPKVLKGLVEELIKECENPPNPDAYCRYQDCGFQPTIYYSDPGFKGYIFLACSEQCCVQYHTICWKFIKMEKELTDKEFLDCPCLTPDCDGVIIKVQSIDKKGDLNKEFLADPKKEPKMKWAKWEKKEKEKKKKKRISESQENEWEKILLRKNSDVNEGSISSTESTERVSTRISQEKKVPKNDVVPEKPKDVPDSHEHSKENDVLDDAPVPSVATEPQGANIPAEEAAATCDTAPSPNFLVSRCIKDNIYAYLADFLQLQGPLRIDDPHLMREISTFPDDVSVMIADCGGIGEFLKNDLRFACVGNLYVCVVGDLATAYKMCSNSSVPSDIKSLDSFECPSYSSYDQCDDIQSFGLNSGAPEFKPAFNSILEGRTIDYKFQLASTSNASQDENSKNLAGKKILDENFNSSKRVLSLDTSSKSEYDSREFIKNLNTDAPEFKPLFQSEYNNYRRKLFKEVKPKHNISDSKQVSALDSFSIMERNTESEVNENTLGEKLLALLNVYFSTDMKKHHQVIDSSIKPYVVKEIQDTKNAGTVTDVPLPPDQSGIVDTLKVENEVLTEQKTLLQKQLNVTKQQNQKLFEEVSKLQKNIKDAASEALAKRPSQKEDQLIKKQEYLVASLTDAHDNINKQKKEMESLQSEKNSLKKDLDEAKVSLQTAEEKFKSTIANQEKKHAAALQNLQQENVTLKCKLQQSDLRILYIKKTEYLKKIEDKSNEASQRRKEFTDGLSMTHGTLNPVFEASMNTLAAQLSTYINELAAIKLDFMLKMDEQLDEIKKGASLPELKDIKMNELPQIPCWNNMLPACSPFTMGSSHMPFSFNMNAGNSATSLPVATTMLPTATVAPPLATALPKVSTVKAVPSMSVALDRNKKHTFEKNSEPLEILHNNPDLQESYKTAMASINSFASAPLSSSAHSLDDDIEKNFALFKPPTALANSKLEAPKVPPGIKNPLISGKSSANLESVTSSSEVLNSEEERQPHGGVDVIPKPAMKISGKNNYERLLGKLREIHPSYTIDELMDFVKEFRARRQGKLSGLPIDAIISHVGDIINAKKNEKRVSEIRNQAKANKVLVNKKLVTDSKPKEPEQPTTKKKKSAWNIGSDAQKKWSGTNSEGSCTICFEDYQAVAAYKVQCGHIFHEHCIRQWLQHQTQCPICRLHVLLPEDYPPLL